MKNSSKKLTVNLSEDEVHMLIEALLFSTSVNVGADWDEENIDDMVTLSKKLKDQIKNKSKFEHIVFYKEQNYEDKWTQSVFDFFKDNLNIVELQEA